MEKQRRVRDPKRTDYVVYKRRSRIWLFILILLATLLLYGLGSYLYSNIFEETSDESEQTDTSAIEQAPTDTTDQEKAAEEEETGQALAPPNDPTLYLTVPRLGIYGHTVRNDRSEAALDLGAAKLPDTSFPWQKGDTNTYIACHRLGWPGLESYHQCLNLPSMQKGDEIYLTDANGKDYEYRVSEFLQVSPDDTWVTKPEAGRKMLSLQTCIESYGDFVTLGPNWTVRFIVRADRVA
jgi:sortase A